jgi:hypothetical protein
LLVVGIYYLIKREEKLEQSATAQYEAQQQALQDAIDSGDVQYDPNSGEYVDVSTPESRMQKAFNKGWVRPMASY